MIQRCIELGEGYADIYEWAEIVRTNRERIDYLLRLDTSMKGRYVCSVAAVLSPSGDRSFQPIYICREGIPHPEHLQNQRYDVIEEAAKASGYSFIPIEVKPSTEFPDTALYYQHLIGILRMNRFIPPLS